MKRLISQILIVLIISISISAQSDSDKIRLVDEFGDVPIADLLSRRLAILRMELSDNENSAALIKIRGGLKAREHFVFPYTWGALMKAYLVNDLQIADSRVRIQNCDLDESDVKVEFLLVPQNYDFPKCDDELVIPKETVLFSMRGYPNPYIGDDYPYEVTGEREAASKISNEIRTKLLNESPGSKIYIIGYLGTNIYTTSKPVRNLDKPNLINKMLQEAETELIQSGTDASRIVKINGGYQDSTRSVEIWFVPKGSAIPKPKPTYFPKRKRVKKT